MSGSNQRNGNADAAALASLEQQVILLEPEEWDAFVRILDGAGEPTPALKALMARKPP